MKGTCDLWGRLLDRPGEEVALAAVSAAELLHGIHRARAAQRPKREAFVESILGTVAVLPFDLRAARIHARIWADLASRGRMVGERDLMIAATAVAYGHRVLTSDARSFPRIPGTDVEIWAASDKKKIAIRKVLKEAIGRRCRLSLPSHDRVVVIVQAGSNTVKLRDDSGPSPEILVVAYEDVSRVRRID